MGGITTIIQPQSLCRCFWSLPLPSLALFHTAKSPSFRPKVLAHFASSEAEKSASPHKSSPAGRPFAVSPTSPKTSMPFEVLDRPLVLLRLFARSERAHVLPPPGLRILVP